MSEINPFTTEDTDLDEAIAAVYSRMSDSATSEEEYAKAVDSLTKLYAIKNSSLKHASDAASADLKHRLEDDAQTFEQMQETRPFYERVDPNTLLTVGGNILIALAVIKYEQTAVISSKVLTFMKKI